MTALNVKKAIPIVEVAAVLGLFFVLRLALKESSLASWQQSIFGAAPISSMLLFLVLPLLFVLAARRNPGASGLTTQRLRYHWRVAVRALAVVAPSTMLFPVVGLVGSEPKQWLGGSILALGFTAAGSLMVLFVRGMDNEPETALGLTGLLACAGLLVAGLAVMALLQPLSTLLAQLVRVLVFVGFLEEFFFRGYVQSRLNESFGKPFSLAGVHFGAGLLLAAALFGLVHPLSALGETTPWAWALWTAAFGLVLGYLREKTGSVVTPGIVHGIMLVPGVLFGTLGQ